MSGKNIVVIGGSSGIGLATVRQLQAEGANVWVASRTIGGLNELSGVQHIPFDVLNDDAGEISWPAELHGLVYCPGSINLKQLRSLTVEDFQKDFDINVLGAVKVLKAARKSLIKSGNSSVVLYSTVAVGQGMPFHASVAASKGAVEGLTRSIAAEWAPKVRVNCIAPSLTDTPLAANLLSSDAKREASDKRHPLRRVGTPEDISALTTFLLSDKSSWISGQIFGVDGGMSALRV